MYRLEKRIRGISTRVEKNSTVPTAPVDRPMSARSTGA